MQNAKMQNRWCNVLVFNEMMFCGFANGFANGFAKHPNIPFLEAQTRPFYAQNPTFWGGILSFPLAFGR